MYRNGRKEESNNRGVTCMEKAWLFNREKLIFLLHASGDCSLRRKMFESRSAPIFQDTSSEKLMYKKRLTSKIFRESNR